MVRNRHTSTTSTRDHSPSTVDFTSPSDVLYGSEMDLEPVTVVDLGQGSVTDGAIVDGGLDGGRIIRPGTLDITPFADNIRPVAIVSVLPTLPNSWYPPLSFAVLSTTGILYKNVANVWGLGVSGADIVADSITAGQIAAGGIGASEIAAGAITAGKISVGVITPAEFNGSPRNLVSNPGFENPVANVWSILSQSISAVRNGKYSGFVGDLTTVYPLNLSPFSVVGGRRYYCSAWARCHYLNTSNFLMYFRIRWLYGDGATIFDSTVGTSALGQSNVWTNYRDTLLAPTNAVSAYVLLIHAGSGSQAWAWWDDFEVYESDQDIDHAGGNVKIDSTGVTITNGKLTVSNAGAVVIIDGTSNMFKIAASGTLNVTASAGTWNNGTVTLTALGALSSAPAHQSFIYRSTAQTASRFSTPTISYLAYGYVATSSGGSPTQKSLALLDHIAMDTFLHVTSSQCVVELQYENGTTNSHTVYGSYYVFKEAVL